MRLLAHPVVQLLRRPDKLAAFDEITASYDSYSVGASLTMYRTFDDFVGLC
jgi:hypothetical protein